LIEAGLDSIWVLDEVLNYAVEASKHDPRRQGDRKQLEMISSHPTSEEAYVNGFWRWPWRRELHIWEVTESLSALPFSKQ
jgi:hypothetical protein